MDLRQAVITARQVIELGSKIIFVYHSKEGWQFFGAEKNILESDARVVSLEKIISLNPHVQQILWIEEGMEAWINGDNNVWSTGIAKYD